MQVNSAYRPAAEWDGRYVDLYGGAGSGKSKFMAQHIVATLTATKNASWLIARKVGKTIRNSCYQEIIDTCYDDNIPFTTNKTEMSVHFPSGSRIICVGVDDPEKLKSIARVNSIWIEEATELTLKEYTQLDLRLRGNSPIPRKLYATYNPIDQYHWLKSEHHDKPDPRRLILKTTWADNAFLDDEYIATLSQISDPMYRKIYFEGDWGVLQGIIYTHWTTGDAPDSPDETIFGLDFGFNNPCALVRVDKKDGKNYATEELYQSNLTTPDLINIIRPIVGNKYVYCDAAEPDRIEELRKAGIKARPAKKDVKLGIDHVKRSPLIVCGFSSNLLKEIRSYKYREDPRTGQIIEEPLKFNDHALDAMRYAIYTDKKGEGIIW